MGGSSNGSISNAYNVSSKSSSPEQTQEAEPLDESKADILVAGSVALDLSCDYSLSKSGNISPALHTSNPAQISQSVGGVGHNVALAAHLASTHARVRLCSMVGDDV